VWLRCWYHWVTEVGAVLICQGGVAFGSLVTVYVKHIRSGKGLFGIFILMPFDVGEGGAYGVALRSCLAYGYIHISVICHRVVGSENGVLSQCSDIGYDSLVVAETMKYGALILVLLVAGCVVSEE